MERGEHSLPLNMTKKIVASKTKGYKAGDTIGLEFDHLAIRAVRLVFDGKGGCAVDDMVDSSGNFSEDANLVEGLREIKDRLKIGAKDKLATCLAGKHISVSQINFRNLPKEEMEPALRIEVRKSLPFEISSATLDYQILGDGEVQSETTPILVAVSGPGILSRHLKVLEKASLAPFTVDVLPVAACNALWNWIGNPKNDSPQVALHIGPQISTIVIDAAKTPFFNRYVYFDAENYVAGDPTSADLDRKLQMLSDEIARSLAFYEKSTFATGFQEIVVLGDFLEIPGLGDRLRRSTGLQVRKMDIPKKMGLKHDKPAGRFDLAAALALREGDEL